MTAVFTANLASMYYVVEYIFSHISQISELLYFESFKDKPYGSKREDAKMSCKITTILNFLCQFFGCAN